ncbi:unnamed protein product [Linum tenue]|uniref:Transcription factor MYC/MYB N-terminal domain-containing protein n=1 Tax=Linum tenue TaxID=586396 RepID=A0AAV0P278_9ROSI|nr:unnamed protein product [Linum tenue]
MEGGFPMLNCLLQYTLRSLCSYPPSSDSNSASSSPKWAYAVFWRILPRNYPPPKWDYDGTAFGRSKANKRNWILVWEDGFCDFLECDQRAGGGRMNGKFGADVFFKLSHEVYSYGEGLVGKVAADKSHKWVFNESINELDPRVLSSYSLTTETQPRAWESQFNSGIQTIAIISVREGIIQLGSFEKIMENLNMVTSIQRKFSYLHSIPLPGALLAVQRPLLHELALLPMADDKHSQMIGMKRVFDKRMANDFLAKSQNGGAQEQCTFSIPPLLPTTMYTCSFGALLSKLPSPYIQTTGDGAVLDSYSHSKTNKKVKFEDEGDRCC